MSDIDSLIVSADIVVFSSDYCPYCSQAVEALNAAGVASRMKVIEASSSHKNTLRSMTGSGSVPSIWIKGKFVGGCNDGPESWMGIRKIINGNKLNDYLQ